MEKYNLQELFNKSSQLIPNCSGIYMFTNNINNKCYIGQAINIRKRLYTHRYNYINNKLTNPLYIAFTKYGIENFTYTVLEYGNFSREELDTFEIKYIKEYNSYNAGYNQTLGADGGILGYKFTSEQIEAAKEHRLNYIKQSKIYQVHIYDITNGTVHTFDSPTMADEYFNWKVGTTRSAYRYKLAKSKYIVYKNEEELKTKLKQLNNYKTGRFESKITKESFVQFIQENHHLSQECLIEKLGICKKTFYNYLHQYMGKSEAQLKKIKIVNTITNETFIGTYELCPRKQV